MSRNVCLLDIRGKGNTEMCEMLTWPWPRSLLRLPAALRAAICVVSFLLCMTVYLLTRSLTYSSSIMIIPIALGAWNFAKKGACPCFFSYIAVMLVYNTLLFKTLLWPPSALLAVLTDALVMLLEGAALVSLRKMLLAEDSARQKAEQSERQVALSNEKLRQLNRIKNQFILNVNHELRTPLTALYGYLEYLWLLLEQQNDSNHAGYAVHIKNALSYCEELRCLVNNVLETIEIDHMYKPVTLEKVSVTALVEDIFTDVALFAREKDRIRLEIPADLYVWAQAQGLRRVLHNLLSNACKFSPRDSPIRVSVSLYHDDPQWVHINIQDAGPGIPPDDIPLLFEQFTRVPRDIAGTIRGIGLGLSISKHLVEVMQGQIWVESTGIPGQGSSFHFTLPRAF